ncbi:AraC-like ligand-binding domain-containing protein [Bordetella trematum]|uniref:AraC-like ligand-binding domain-containing protein n=1 Tax=Bordetella trematum TaxID=123899 RepID=UPI000D9CA82A|nr:helix-turn-helix domain-containing protein [Bordetella trematum]SPU48618.1 AraC family transcriptional regulator [Bordetella trematum]VDH05138.1 Transcriptional activator feaR [Bordetella trematum]
MADMTFATTQVDPRRRLDSWREALADAFGPFEVHAGQGRGAFAGRLRYLRRANLQFNDLHYQGQKLERTRGNVSQLDEEFYTFGLPLAGPLAVLQEGRRFEVEPGCVYLMNQSAPYQAVAQGEGGYRSLSISFPRAALAQRAGRLESFYKLRVDDGGPQGLLLKSYLDHLLGGMPAWSEAEVGALGEHLIDLIVLFLVQSQAAQASELDSSVTLAHRERALAYMRRQLSDPALTPALVAQACGISLSYLHRIFQAAGLGVESQLYVLRLEHCRRLLQDPVHAHRSIAELAFQSGFAHAAHFSRQFRQRFGMTAREYRAAARQAGGRRDAIGG